MKSSEFSKVEESIHIVKKIGKARVQKSTPHYHNAYEIHYFLDGEITFFIRDQSYKIKKGDILIIDTYEMHNPVYNLYDYEKILLTFKPSFTDTTPMLKIPDLFSILNKKLGGIRVISIPGDMQAKLEPILFNMLDADSAQGQYRLNYLHSYLSLFLMMLAEYLESGLTNTDQVSLLDQKVMKIIAHIDANLDKPLSLDGLAGYLNINKYYLCRFFKKSTGLSVIDYVNHKRILTAEKLLLQNKHTITDISLMVGFNNLTHFERTFKKLTGASPRSYKINGGQERPMPP
jgi:AraC-like DNA-binding protein